MMLNLLRASAPAAMGLALAAASLGAPALAQQDYAGLKPIRWVVPYPAGGGSDMFARVVGKQLSTVIGQPVVIENKPGGSSAIGAADVARGPADGSVIMNGDNGTFVNNPLLFSKLIYKVEDLKPVMLTARFPLVLLASPQSGYRSLKQVIDAAKADKDKVKFASVGAGTPHHLAMEMLMAAAGFSAVHVPYRGAAPALQDTVGGHVPIMAGDIATGLTHIRSGALIPLAVFSAERSKLLPDVPTVAELGYPTVVISAWQGIAVSAGTPDDVVAKLSKALNVAMFDPGVRKVLEETGTELVGGAPRQMADYIAAQSAIWSKLIAERGLRIE